MDKESDTTTLSPTPFSPFSSTQSCGSEGGTSDEPADLGQFSAVFEILRAEFQPRRAHPPATFVLPRTITPASSLLVSASSDGDEDALFSTAAWSQSIPIGSHHDYHSYSDNDDSNIDHCYHDGNYSYSDDHDDEVLDQPSLGYLDDVLGFLAAERAKFTAQREALGCGASSQASTSESAWRHVIEPRRRRRRKRGGKASSSNGAGGGGNSSAGGGGSGMSGGMTNPPGDADADAEGVMTPIGGVDVLDNSSSSEQRWTRGHGKSMPATPPHGGNTSNRLRKLNGIGIVRGKDPVTVVIPGTSATIPVHPKLSHSRSTPSLRVTIPLPPDARVLRLRTLATKLRMLFTEDAKFLSSVLLNDVPDEDGFLDPRGRPPEGRDPLIHVFIDHSNILIGFLNHLRRYPVHHSRRSKTHLSHAALTLILERGRPISRRVLAASSPLYQPVESAERLGYEVRVYVRVPDLGDGIDRERAVVGAAPPAAAKGHGRSSSGSTAIAASFGASGSRRNASAANGDSEQGQPMSLRGASMMLHAHAHAHVSSGNSPSSNGVMITPSSTAPLSSVSVSASTSASATTAMRIRYREQGVDELLQLKLHQAIADADTRPHPSSTSGCPGTIVLATGDGNAGQFNADGFLGAVRTALRKGWRVELYAWEYGLSRAWVKEFGNGDDGQKGSGPYGDRFRIVGLEKFAQDLLEIP